MPAHREARERSLDRGLRRLPAPNDDERPVGDPRPAKRRRRPLDARAVDEDERPVHPKALDQRTGTAGLEIGMTVAVRPARYHRHRRPPSDREPLEGAVRVQVALFEKVQVAG